MKVRNPDTIAKAPKALLVTIRRPKVDEAEDRDNFAKMTKHTLQQARELLAELDKHEPEAVNDYDFWREVGMMLKTQFGQKGMKLWGTWSKSSDKYPGVEVLRRKWNSFKGTGLTMATLQYRVNKAKKVRSPIPVLTVDEFLARPRPNWRVKGILPETGLAAIYGASGSGKTFFALDLTSAIVSGDSWRGRKVTQGRVAYVAAEGAAGFRNRIEALHRKGKDLSGLLAIPAAPPLTSADDAKAYVEAIQAAGGADVVVIDTMPQVTPGIDENSGEMKLVIEAGKIIADELCALVIFISHSGKDETKGLRGWSGVRAALDTEIKVFREGESEGRGAIVTKQKDGEDNEKFGFRLRTISIGKDEDGDPITTCLVVDSDFPDDVAEPQGKNQKLVFDVAGRCADDTGRVERSVLRRKSEAKLPDSERRKDLVLNAVKGLIKNGLLIVDGPLHLKVRE